MAAAAPHAPSLGLPSVKLSSGHSMPLFGLGTWQSGKDEVRKAVVAALEAGYTAIDGAAGYANEAEVGDALADCIARGVCKREEVFLTSKLWAADFWPDKAAAALEKTLSELKTSYVDLYLIHWRELQAHARANRSAPSADTSSCCLRPRLRLARARASSGASDPAPPPPRRRLSAYPIDTAKGATFNDQRKEMRTGYDPAHYLAVWRVLEAAVDAGKIRSIGTSNMSALKLSQLLAHARIPPAVNQVESHPFCAQTKLMAWCAKRNIVITAFSPLGSPARPARLVAEGDPAPLFHPVIVAIAERTKKTAAQVLIKWQIQRGVVVIPKSVTPARIVENAQVSDFDLSADDMAAIAALDANHRLNKGGSWTLEGQSTDALWDDDWAGLAE
jgi:diketogulonate reductase-like aldo/keto reductase